MHATLSGLVTVVSLTIMVVTVWLGIALGVVIWVTALCCRTRKEWLIYFIRAAVVNATMFAFSIVCGFYLDVIVKGSYAPLRDTLESYLGASVIAVIQFVIPISAYYYGKKRNRI